jgi:hypothetical protein
VTPHRRGSPQHPPHGSPRPTRDGLAAQPTGHTRAPGAGPKPLSATDPGLLDALDSLVDPDTRGDPCSPLRWTTKSLRQLPHALGRAGHMNRMVRTVR